MCKLPLLTDNEKIDIEFILDEKQLTIKVSDAKEYIPEGIDKCKDRKLGILIIKSLMDKVEFNDAGIKMIKFWIGMVVYGKQNYYNKENLEKEDIRNLLEDIRKRAKRKYAIFLHRRHLYIAEILSKKYANRGIDYDDIYQVACIGLIYAIDRYDIDKGFEFSSFATPTIIGEIKKYFRDKGWTIRVQEEYKNYLRRLITLRCN